MFTRKVPILVMAFLLTASISPLVWGAAIDVPWSGSITLSNPTSNVVPNVTVNFYGQGSSTIVATKSFTNLAAHSATSFATTEAALNLPPSFSGAAVIESDGPVLAQYVAWSPTAGIDRAIYNGFNPSEASTNLYFPMFSYNANSQLSTLALQNTEAVDATVTLDFYDLAGAFSASVTGDTITASSVKHYKAGTFTPTTGALPSGWQGVVRVNCTSGQKLVGAVFQPYTVGNKVVSYEGIASGAATVFIPSIVKKYGSVQQTTYVAVQNLTASPVTATFNVSDISGNVALASAPVLNLPAFSKQVFNPITTTLPDGFTGSAQIVSTGSITAVANIGSTGTNFAEAYAGLSAGAQSVGLSYVRWDYQNWRTYLAIQNVSANPVDVTVRYYDNTGTLLGTKVINGVLPNAKTNSNPGEASLPGGTLGIGGNATIEATGNIIVFANNVTFPDMANAAGYTAVPFTP
jgi:hypothetical protein